MCGRYYFDTEKDILEVIKILEELNSKHIKTGEIFPTDNVAIISKGCKKMTTSIMKWGFPKWDGKGVIINAKSETCAEKKMFSKPLMEKRCVIPSTGFFEWQKNDDSKKKDKYLFTMKDTSMLYMAGLYNLFKINDTLLPCFVILTQEANSSISDIHNRMPVILYKDELENWLFDNEYIDKVFSRNDIILNHKIN